MKKLKFLIALLSVGSLMTSCKDDDNSNVIPLRDYAEQYASEISALEEYLETHYITVNSDFDYTINKIPANGSQTPIKNHPNLTFKMVDFHDIQYKLYYIKLREGVNERPSSVDSVLVSYKGVLLDGTQFDNRPLPMWFKLDEVVVEGWKQLIPEFKTGNFENTDGPNPISFTDFGAGVMFVPSGLAYYNNVTNSVPSYSTMVFGFKLNGLRYRDHDGDGILSKDEVAEPFADPRKYDSDGDGIMNYLDVDDDNDGVLTKREIQDGDGNRYPFDLIPTCPGGTLKRHLDPACYQ